MFHLSKWYLDLVTDDGVVVVAYAARLTWGRVGLGYASVLRSMPGQPPDETSVFGQTEQPNADGDRLVWKQRSLGITARWERLAAPIHKPLLESAAGGITWTCVMPAARASIELKAGRYRGIGYVEQLTLTIPPWDLPFNALRWGRHASETHSVVWIEWRGSDMRRLVWLDGTEQPSASLDASGVIGLRDEARVELGTPRDLCARPALSRVIDRLPQFSKPIAGRMAAMFEHKMVAPSRLLVAGTAVDSGWSVFEEVTW